MKRAVSRALASTGEEEPPWTDCVDPDFAPPEMRIGNHTGPATDLYGIAGVALFALTGERPRHFSSGMAVLEQVLVSEHNGPRVWALFLAVAISRNVEERFASVAAALDVISGRAEAQAKQAAAAAAARSAGDVYPPDPDRARAHVRRAATLGGLLSIPYLLLMISGIGRFGPFPPDLPLGVGLVVALLCVAGTVVNLAVLVQRARTEHRDRDPLPRCFASKERRSAARASGVPPGTLGSASRESSWWGRGAMEAADGFPMICSCSATCTLSRPSDSLS